MQKIRVFAVCAVVWSAQCAGSNCEIELVRWLGELNFQNVERVQVQPAILALQREPEYRNGLAVPIFRTSDRENNAVMWENQVFRQTLEKIIVPESSLPLSTSAVQLSLNIMWFRIHKQLEIAGEIPVLSVIPPGKHIVIGDDENDAVSELRKTWAARRLEHFLNVYPSELPEFVLEQGDGWLFYGMLAPIIPGNATEKPGISSLSDAQAFTFLIGHSDLSTLEHNYAVHGGQLGIFDFEHAFCPGIVYHRGDNFMGSFLPKRYTPIFSTRVKCLNDEVLMELVGKALTKNEFRALRVRRDILLKDLEIRASSAILTP